MGLELIQTKLKLDESLKYVDNKSNTDVKKLIEDCQPKEKNTLVMSTVNGQFSHKNYMEYLETCYDKHMGYVISPELIWYVLLSEISGHIKNNSERYRDLFTDSDEKKEISVECWDVNGLPELLVGKLKSVVPTNIKPFMPEFTTETPDYKFAVNAAFCDAVSPFYSYSMYCCGYPSVTIKGTKVDWCRVRNCFKWIGSRILKLDSNYVWTVEQRIDTIIASIDNNGEDIAAYKQFYNDIFKLKRCGSGGQVEASGWLTELYMTIPSMRYTYNFSTQVAQLNYKNLSDNHDYMFATGIMKSTYDPISRVSTPEFGRILYKLDKDEG